MTKYEGTITIDGKGVFKYVLEQISGQQQELPGAIATGGQATAPGGQAPKPPVTVNIPPPAPTSKPLANGEEIVTVMLMGHQMKSGVSAKGHQWERHTFRGSDNRAYVTFENEVVSRLSPLVGQGTPVKIRGLRNNFKGVDIKEVLGT